MSELRCGSTGAGFALFLVLGIAARSSEGGGVEEAVLSPELSQLVKVRLDAADAEHTPHADVDAKDAADVELDNGFWKFWIMPGCLLVLGLRRAERAAEAMAWLPVLLLPAAIRMDAASSLGCRWWNDKVQ